MDRTKTIAGIAIAVLLGAGGFFFFAGQSERSGRETAGKQTIAEDAVFGLVFLDDVGNSVKLAEYRGKNLVITAWATWSPYSAAELEALTRLEGEYGDLLTVIAVNRGESREAAHSYLVQKNLEGSVYYFFDPGDSFFKTIHGFSMPETLFIDTGGGIRFHKRGPMNKEELRRRAQDIFGI